MLQMSSSAPARSQDNHLQAADTPDSGSSETEGQPSPDDLTLCVRLAEAAYKWGRGKSGDGRTPRGAGQRQVIGWCYLPPGVSASVESDLRGWLGSATAARVKAGGELSRRSGAILIAVSRAVGQVQLSPSKLCGSSLLESRAKLATANSRRLEFCAWLRRQIARRWSRSVGGVAYSNTRGKHPSMVITACTWSVVGPTLPRTGLGRVSRTPVIKAANRWRRAVHGSIASRA